MEERHIEELKGELSDSLLKFVPRRTANKVRSKVSKAIDKLTEDNKLLSLPPDECQLLLDYRLWKQSPDSATGLFHWRRPSKYV